MKDLIDSLNLRYETALKSSSDSLFYQNVHHYYDLVEKTPQLNDIVKNSQEEYADKHGDIWSKKSSTEEESKIKNGLTNKLERFNLYALSAGINMCIYLPIEEYKNSTEIDREQDPNVLLMLRGIKNIPKEWADKKYGPHNRWERKTLELYNKQYGGKRASYESELRQFHLLLVAEIEKTKVVTINKPTADFSFDTATGAFSYKKTDGTMSPKSREFHFLAVLYSSPTHQATHKELLLNADTVSKHDKITLAETIKVVKRKLGILPKNKYSNPDIIKSIPKHGYKLDI